jgi:hypothetical protein
MQQHDQEWTIVVKCPNHVPFFGVVILPCPLYVLGHVVFLTSSQCYDDLSCHGKPYNIYVHET